jgi:hypothetical protein
MLPTWKWLLTRIACVYIVLSKVQSTGIPSPEKRQVYVNSNESDIPQAKYAEEFAVVKKSNSIFGGGLSLCNAGLSTLHVSLSLTGPVYYHNYLQPGQCRDWNGIGNVWFSVLGRTGYGRDFTTAEVALHILFMVLLIFGALIAMNIVILEIQSGSSVREAVAECVERGWKSVHEWPFHVSFVFVLFIFLCFFSRGRDTVIASGVFANCKRWDVIGGEVMRPVDGTEGDYYYPFGLVNERDYACGSD